MNADRIQQAKGKCRGVTK